MIRQQIVDGMKEAMKAHEAVRLSVLRYLLSEIKNREIDTKHELSDDEVTEILRREVKRRYEAVEQFKQGGRMDIVENEQAELVIIETFLPKLMTKEDLEAVVDKVIPTVPVRDFGQVMRAVMAEVKGKADGKMVSDVVKSKLAS